VLRRFLSREHHPSNDQRVFYSGASAAAAPSSEGAPARAGSRRPAERRTSGGAWNHLDAQMAAHVEALLVGRKGPAAVRAPRGVPLEHEPGAQRIAAAVARLDAQRAAARRHARAAAADAAAEQREVAEVAARAAATVVGRPRTAPAARPGRSQAGAAAAGRGARGATAPSKARAASSRGGGGDWSQLLL
jgi:hypothetical protein